MTPSMLFQLFLTGFRPRGKIVELVILILMLVAPAAMWSFGRRLRSANWHGSALLMSIGAVLAVPVLILMLLAYGVIY